MAATTRERPGRYARHARYDFELGANVKANKGAAAVIDTRAASPTRGYCIPAVAAVDLVAVGRFAATRDNTGGANGAKKVSVVLHRDVQTIAWNNSSGTPVTKADRGSQGYLEDDQTVTPDATTKSSGGMIWDVDDDGLIQIAGSL